MREHMYAMKTAGNADIPVLPVTRRFDPRKHRRITGLFDLWLEPGPRGGLVLPARPDRLLTPRSIADLVRRSGEAANDVRILTDDGARHSGLLSEVAGLLAHDVLVGPDGAVIRHHAGRDGTGPLHAVPLDRASHRPKDWLVIQPPDLATPLPGWFTVDRGLVHPRKGVVGLPLRGGLVLATRADFVTRRATAHQLGTASGGLVTVAVTARAGGFLVGDYGGTQRVYSGGQLAALLGDLPLYGSDLRLWLTWPSDLDEQHVLAAQALALAETTGATVWTPPPGGGAELIDGQRDLRALDHAGEPVEWHAYRPRFATGPPVLRTTPDGLLVPASERPGVVLRAWSRPDRSPVAEAAPPADVRVLVPRGGDTALPLPDGPHAGPLEPHQEASDLHAFRATLRMLRAPDPPRSAPRHQAVPADPPPAPPPKKPPAVSLAPFPRPHLSSRAAGRRRTGRRGCRPGSTSTRTSSRRSWSRRGRLVCRGRDTQRRTLRCRLPGSQVGTARQPPAAGPDRAGRRDPDGGAARARTRSPSASARPPRGVPATRGPPEPGVHHGQISGGGPR
ncbi:hypothetical protein ACFQ1L_33680 [Phytohabitans flavus]|uniref:hypothetical protein n=1 Tax=Phytohabitans flavus TaxID=1076124 RepID=UPI00363C0ACD